jgi:glycosyltransferase 2 family protein
MSVLRARSFEVACLGLGATLLAGILWQIGLSGLGRDLHTIGWGLAVIVLLQSADVLFNTCAWGLAFPAGERTVSGRRLFAARLAGDGVNYLTPLASVGGEVLRVRLLGSGMPLGLRWASVSVAKLGQTVAQAIFVILGLALVLPHTSDVPPGVAALAGAGSAVLVGLALVWLLARGVWTTFEGVVRGLGLAAWLPAAWAQPGRELDSALTRLSGWRLLGSLACFLAGWVVGAVEIYVILAWLGGPAEWQTALAVETGSVFIDGILFFVPAKLGTQEGGKVALFAALGLPPARGLTVGVVRRIRELTYAGLGLAALGLLTARGATRRPLSLAAGSQPRRRP